MSAPRYYHWSASPITELRDRQGEQKVDFKPAGLWFDVEEEWKAWCIENEFGLERLAYRQRVIILASERILRLTKKNDLLRFTKKFAVWPEFYPAELHTKFHRSFIDWPKVAAQYAGVLIAPYCWSLRLELPWYYGWDCAAGCVWDPSVIQIGPAEVLLSSQK
jgi:hypothetical protein